MCRNIKVYRSHPISPLDGIDLEKAPIDRNSIPQLFRNGCDIC